MARSPWRRIPLASIAAGLTAERTRWGSNSLRQLDTSHGCQDHTVLPYATASLVLRGSIAHDPKTSLRPPCNASRAQRYRVHRNPHSTYRDDAYAPLHEAGWRVKEADLPRMRSGIFLTRNLDDPNRVEMVREIRVCAQSIPWDFRRAAARSRIDLHANASPRARARRLQSRDVSRRGNGTEVGHGPSGFAAPPRPRYAAIRGYGRGRPQPPACRRGCSGRLSSWMRSSMTDFRPSLERWQGSQRRRGRRERDGVGGCFGRA